MAYISTFCPLQSREPEDPVWESGGRHAEGEERQTRYVLTSTQLIFIQLFSKQLFSELSDSYFYNCSSTTIVSSTVRTNLLAVTTTVVATILTTSSTVL